MLNSNKIDFEKSRNLIQELTETILDQRIGENHEQELILKNLKELNDILQAHEKALSRLETGGKVDVKVLETWEKELLDQFKQHDRLLHMVNMNNPDQSSTKKISNMAKNRDRLLGQSSARAALLGNNNTDSSGPPSSSKDALIDMGDSELLQLQDRIMDQQDQQLDSLSQVLGRQKKIGELIGQTLDEQVNILDQVEGRVDGVQNGLDVASNRVNTFMAASSEDSKLCYTILGLFLLLIIVIYLTRLF